MAGPLRSSNREKRNINDEYWFHKPLPLPQCEEKKGEALQLPRQNNRGGSCTDPVPHILTCCMAASRHALIQNPSSAVSPNVSDPARITEPKGSFAQEARITNSCTKPTHLPCKHISRRSTRRCSWSDPTESPQPWLPFNSADQFQSPLIWHGGPNLERTELTPKLYILKNVQPYFHGHQRWRPKPLG